MNGDRQKYVDMKCCGSQDCDVPRGLRALGVMDSAVLNAPGPANVPHLLVPSSLFSLLQRDSFWVVSLAVPSQCFQAFLTALASHLHRSCGSHYRNALGFVIAFVGDTELGH